MLLMTFVANIKASFMRTFHFKLATFHKTVLQRHFGDIWLYYDLLRFALNITYILVKYLAILEFHHLSTGDKFSPGKTKKVV